MNKLENDGNESIDDLWNTIVSENQVFLRIRYSYILAKIMNNKSKKDKIHIDMVMYFRNLMNNQDLRTDLELRDAVFETTSNRIAYLAKLPTDEEYKYNEKLEKEIQIIEMTINDYIAYVKEKMISDLI